MTPNNWNKETYQDFVKYLITIKDENYKKFHSSLCLNCKYEMLGIRLPNMRKIAKEISKTNIEQFLKIAQDNYYEEVMIQGLVISYIKDEKVFYKYFKEYIKKIDNWALCDTFCNSIKIINKYEDKYFNESINLALSQQEFISRVGFVTILSHFIKKEYLTTIFETLNKMQSEKYYINMAEAWLVCEMYIKFPIETLEFIKNNNMNIFTHNKSINKIRDSYRVNKDEKEYLNTLKR